MKQFFENLQNLEETVLEKIFFKRLMEWYDRHFLRKQLMAFRKTNIAYSLILIRTKTLYPVICDHLR